MKIAPITVNQCISKLLDKAHNMEYAEIEGLLTWSVKYLKYQQDLLKKMSNSFNELDGEYCHLINNYNLMDYELPEQYNKWIDDSIKVEEYLGIK